MQSGLTRRGFLGMGAALGGAVAAGTVGGTALGGAAWAGERQRRHPARPTLFNLPNGFHPDGIAIGRTPHAYVGSLLGGGIYRFNLFTGAGSMAYPGVNQGQFDARYMAVGLEFDHYGRLFVGGGWGCVIKVHDPISGRILRTYQVGGDGTAVDQVTATPRAVWFTDGFKPQLYCVPLGPLGELPEQDRIVTLPLGGEWVQGADGVPSASGICPTPDGRALLVINVAPEGAGLFRVDPRTGNATRVDVGSATLTLPTNALLARNTLYAPQLDSVTVLDLDRDATRGVLRREITDPRFDVPCAVAKYGDQLYLPNARFPLPPTPETPYNTIAVPAGHAAVPGVFK